LRGLRVTTLAVTVLCSARAAHGQVRAIDLPAEAPVPTGVDLAKSFTFRMCVRMNTAPDDLPLLAANKPWVEGEIRDYTTNNAFGLGRESGKVGGFAISVLRDGAWTWNAGDGRSRIDHRPEMRDQTIADGHWHEVGFSIDRKRGVARLYHDGRRVALHDLGGVRSLQGETPAVRLGTADADVEIGAVRLDPGVLSRERVSREFVDRFGNARRPATLSEWDGRPLRILAWNIWHGGRRKGRDEGVRRVVEVIEQCDADIVLMQETYGSGPRISGRLGFDYFLRSSNLSVMSRFPIVDVHRLGQAFRFGGVTIELRPGVRVQAYSLWISHLPSVQEQLAAGATAEELAAADDEKRGREMRAILDVLMPHLARTPEMPVIVGGDFNSGSHQDWTAAAADQPNHMGRVVAWPVSLMMHDAGFVDTFRAAHPDPVEHPGLTWSPEFRDSHQDRIDYVYVRGSGWSVEESAVLSEHPRGWPSDHAAVLSVLRLEPN
jgi:endonuclease/exonuclease/phosphatase family metal-dependent hydrolase